jgi:hypothetical protein
MEKFTIAFKTKLNTVENLGDNSNFGQNPRREGMLSGQNLKGGEGGIFLLHFY